MVEMNQEQNQEQNQSENQGDQNASDYRDGFTPELKTALEKFPDVQKLADGYVALEKDASRLRNSKGVTVPEEGATPEEITAFHKSIGVPATPDGYEIVKPDLPEGMEYNEDRMNKFSTLAHSKGIPKAAFQEIVNAYNEEQKAEFETLTKAADDFKEKTTAEMKKLWGNDFGVNLAQADAAIGRVFGEEFKKVLIDTGLNNHPAVIKGMFKASQAIGEHALVSGDQSKSGTGPLTTGKLREMQGDPRYWDPSRRDNDYVKTTEQYAKDLTEQSGANANP